ncbi:hypothetical protein L6164_018448 [Bauhinia variegata]|uniref:Uncharacterized protein n=1 Tax=Bauhinia variegata TaxID=167791 RepID=A0ACB9NBB4_BAUVA|nr:hypothetical protein L6164_018448 [Bauhinia variegata]
MSRSIEPPPPPKYSIGNSKRRVCSGSGSRFMDPDVVEIPPPIHRPWKLVKQNKEAIPHDVIDIDNDEDSDDIVLIGEKVGKSNKGKTIETGYNGYGDLQSKEMTDYVLGPPAVEKFGPASGVQSSNNYASVPLNSIGVDSHGAVLSNDGDGYADLFSDDYMDLDQYALLEAHFDNVDIPPAIEAPIPLMPNFDLSLKKTGSSSLLCRSLTQPNAQYSHMTDLSHPSWSFEPANPKTEETLGGSSSFQTDKDAMGHPSGLDLFHSEFFSEVFPGKNNSATLQHGVAMSNMSVGVETSKPQWFPGPFQSKKEHPILHESTNNGSVDNSKATMLVPGFYPSNFFNPVDGLNHPPGIESANPWWKESHNYKASFPKNAAYSNFFYPFGAVHSPEHILANAWGQNPWVQNSVREENNGSASDSPVVVISDEEIDQIVKNFQQFKQFDTVEDFSDHYYVRNNSSMKQNSKNWAKRIQEEWKILEKDLPDTIFVRIYESRIDLLRAVIIGAQGTPYHDGLFFFDVFFPSGYPNVPPQVHYHSGGLRLNPNLYNCGKVCLSLLNTWSGSKNEKWIPGVSTILQVLVSIQALILNTMPYFNEPGYARTSRSASGQMKALQYNEDTFILSLKTMMYMIRRPPKNFRDFVLGHFRSRAHDILVACKAYMDGAQVGCVKGGVQDVDEGDRSCSEQFKKSLAHSVDQLVKEFAKIGFKDSEKFISATPSIKKRRGEQAGDCHA